MVSYSCAQVWVWGEGSQSSCLDRNWGHVGGHFRMSASKILLTTSRNPTDRMRTLCNDLARILPNAVRVNRGKMSNEQLAEKALEEGPEHVLMIERGQGGSGSIRFCNVGQSGLVCVPPTVQIGDTKLRRDFNIPSRVKPARGVAILSSVPSDDMKKFAEMLAGFFGVPLLSIEEVPQDESLIVLDRDRAGRLMVTFITGPDHVEVGPRVTVSDMEWTPRT